MSKLINNKAKSILIVISVSFLIFLACLLVSDNSIIKNMEMRSYDLRVARRASAYFSSIQAQSHKKSPDLVVVPIDPKALQNHQEPLIFWTKHFAKVVQSLVDGGAKVVCLDFHFQISSDQYFEQELNTIIEQVNKTRKDKIEEDFAEYLPRWDKTFAKVLRCGKVVVMGYIGESGDLVLPHEFFTYSAGIDNIGMVNVEPDADSVVRRQRLIFADRQKQSYPSFDLLATSKFLELKPKYEQSGDKITLGTRTIPVDKKSEILINYLSSDTFSGGPAFSELITKAEAGDTSYFREQFNNKLVVIGPFYNQSGDLTNTPFNIYKSKELFGVEVHANTINTILMGDFIHKAPSGVNMLFLLFACLATSGACYYLKPLQSSALSAFCLFAIIIASFYLFYAYNIHIDMILPMIGIVVCYGITFALRYFFEERRRNAIRKVLGRFVSEPVAQAVLKDPEALKLGGSRMEVSILFCDINDFTPISEKNSPEFIIEMLNDYFTQMEKVIFENKGTLKQFTGDEIMVICGAPQPNPNHALQCVKIAVLMCNALDKWNNEREKQGKSPVKVKFGLHCGQVVAGNVGSPNRSEYSVIGDVVNTTSRIMGLTKITGARILASKELFDKVKNEVVAESKGSHTVKGRTNQVEVYEIKGLTS